MGWWYVCLCVQLGGYEEPEDRWRMIMIQTPHTHPSLPRNVVDQILKWNHVKKMYISSFSPLCIKDTCCMNNVIFLLDVYYPGGKGQNHRITQPGYSTISVHDTTGSTHG